MKLYIVPTPIGNLKDITLRALEILQSVELILAEDTRTSRRLLQHYSIETELRSHHAHNENEHAGRITKEILSGKEIALISDAGTPGISDPGYSLIKACLDEGVEVECLPGACAIIPAVVASGLPCNRFYFEGFLPHKKGRQTRLKQLAEMNCTSVIYESPHRIHKCIQQLLESCGPERKVVVCREITKMYEEFVRGTLQELNEQFNQNEVTVKGEFVVVLEGNSEKKKKK